MRIYRRIYSLHVSEAKFSFKGKLYLAEEHWTDAFEPPTPNARIAPSGVKIENFERFVMVTWIIPTEDDEEVIDHGEEEATGGDL